MNSIYRQEKAEISIVLGSYNRLAFLKKAIQSIRENGIQVPYEILVVDGGSTDGSLRWLAKQKDIITIVQHNHGTFHGRKLERRSWGYFMNLGFRSAQGKYLLMISDDSLLVPDSVMNGYRFFESALAEGQPLGALAFYWRNWPGQKEYVVGRTFEGHMYVNHGMYLRSAYDAVGGLEEDELTFYYADTDFCLKLLQAGYQTEACPDAFVEHFEHASMRMKKNNLVYAKKQWETFVSRWQGIYYHADQPEKGSWQMHPDSVEFQAYRKFPKRIYGIIVYRKSVDAMKQIIKSIARGLGLEAYVTRSKDD